ncbi:START-like domain [Chlorella sorokiniana]|uniref:START-like domain n=1 Tax=Chlorella sorokiniana TaxID=3076 RepID=A0A2P6TZ88_CHLSO|nr:START-like domain [Chlorella sorokiniana]|eukprot:PRW59375.1 START-like domain [Chlorella sorokiniana]
MGQALGCCRAPRRADSGEAVKPRGDPAANGAPVAAAAAPAAAPLPAAGSPRFTHRTSLSGYYSATGYSSNDDDDEWHDALSDIGSEGLAEALEEWEQERQYHDSSVDAAIQVLKMHGHLLPPELEARASEQRAEDRAAAERQRAAALEAGAQVVVQAAPRPPPAVKLERSRSQELRSTLNQPAARAALGKAAALAAEARVLSAHSVLLAAAQQAGCSLAEIAALPRQTLQALLPEGATLDIEQVIEDASWAKETLAALEDHSGWMTSRSDALQVHYRHQRGTTVHSLKFAAVFDHPLEHLLALAHEFDLIVTWNKFSLASDMLAEPSIFESYVYGAQWMMKPFKHMQALLRCCGFDLAEEHQCLLVDIRDCGLEELPAGHKPVPKEWGKRKLINILPGSCIKMRPLPPSPDGTPRTEAALMVHLDPHIPFIPAFLLNFVLGVLAPYVFNQMRHVLDTLFADEAGVYTQRIAAQPHIYEYVRQRMSQYEDQLRPLTEEEAAAEAAPHKKQRRKSSRLGSPA